MKNIGELSTPSVESNLAGCRCFFQHDCGDAGKLELKVNFAHLLRVAIRPAG